jgi:uncharacterized repeat protein (TIGR01451 family)
LNDPAGLAFDAAGNLYIADASNHRVRRVDGSSFFITTLAGDGVAGYSGDGGPATSASLNNPTSVAIDGLGRLYIGDEFNYRVRRVDLGTGTIATVAGTGTSGFSGDGGAATSANVQVTALATDSEGNLFLTSSSNRRVRFVDATTGLIETIAGNGLAGFAGDGGPAVLARLNRPAGVALDGAGNLLLADSSNDRIRRVELEADLGITKDDGRANAPVGGPIEYTVAVTNYGPGTVSKLRVGDSLPPEILFPVFAPSSAPQQRPAPGRTELSRPGRLSYLTGQISGAAYFLVTPRPYTMGASPTSAGKRSHRRRCLLAPADLNI